MSWSMESTHDAAVASAEVFRLYADPDTWGAWAHNTAWGRPRTAMAEGTEVDVRIRSYPWTYTVRVLELEPGHRMVTQVRPVGVTITSTYQVTATGDGSRLHHTISLVGPLERLYELLTRRTYTRMLHEETRKVAELAGAGSAA
ncbi:MAG TPA: SRPBCC family protein [Candidatus Limnocylindrales bacterium]|nr:SRPBCC family protein [Candidatus Limnocylindrales bacterium]